MLKWIDLLSVLLGYILCTVCRCDTLGWWRMYECVVLAMPTDRNMIYSCEGEKYCDIILCLANYASSNYSHIITCHNSNGNKYAMLNNVYTYMQHTYIHTRAHTHTHTAYMHKQGNCVQCLLFFQIQDHMPINLAQPSWRRQERNWIDNELLQAEWSGHLRQNQDLHQNTSNHLLHGRNADWKPSHCSKYSIEHASMIVMWRTAD